MSIPFDTLVGKTITKIDNKDDYELRFECSDGSKYMMCHIQDCCEDVHLEDVVGDFDDLIGTPIVRAEVVSNSEDPVGTEYQPESYTWTYYKLDTVRGGVHMRWLGTSNGYYSEAVDFVELENA